MHVGAEPQAEVGAEAEGEREREEHADGPPHGVLVVAQIRHDERAVKRARRPKLAVVVHIGARDIPPAELVDDHPAKAPVHEGGVPHPADEDGDPLDVHVEAAEEHREEHRDEGDACDEREVGDREREHQPERLAREDGAEGEREVREEVRGVVSPQAHREVDDACVDDREHEYSERVGARLCEKVGQHAVGAAAPLAEHEVALGGEEAEDGGQRVEGLLDVDKEEDPGEVVHVGRARPQDGGDRRDCEDLEHVHLVEDVAALLLGRAREQRAELPEGRGDPAGRRLGNGDCSRPPST